MPKEPEICLINTPSTFLADERVFPPLGILKIASVLRQAGIAQDVLDLSGYSNYSQILETYLRDSPTETFGISATTPQIPAAAQILETIRANKPNARVILGGAHSTLTHTAYKLDQASNSRGRGTEAFKQLTEMFDVVVDGDGERAVLEAVKQTAPNVIDAGSLTSNLFLKRGELVDFPFPSRDLLDIHSYHYDIDGTAATSIIAQLGCPFKCGFCGGRDSHAFRITRTRPTDHIIEEIDSVYKATGIRGFMFWDDELNINNDSLMSLLEGLTKYQEKQGIEMKFRGYTKGELFTLEQARAMYRAGFRVILSGTESGSDEVLTSIQKNTTRDVNTRWVENCHQAGLKAKALMSIGHPGERPETLDESLQWVLANLRPNWDEVDWTIITEYPGSPYFDRSVSHNPDRNSWVYTAPKTGQRLYSQSLNYVKQAEYYKGVPGDYTSYVWTDYLSPKQLVQYRDRLEKISRRHLGLPPIQQVEPRQTNFNRSQSLPSDILRSSP